MNTSTNDDLLMIRPVKKPNHHLYLEELQVPDQFDLFPGY